ncbi:MAG: polysaccharide deacetylase, partial [Nitriliruptoraceae bacterium]
NGSGVDRALPDHLADLAVPATLVLNARWIEANRALTRGLAREPRYELAHHGTEHRPLSVNGRSAYASAGTAAGVAAVSDGPAPAPGSRPALPGRPTPPG